jgi:uncharacterized protein (DUF983 family)
MATSDGEHRVTTPQPAQPRPRRPRPEVPTLVQLGLKPRTMMLRGLFGRCPVCGGRHIFRRWFTMVERCPTCSLHYERVEGHWIGAIGVNTVCVMGLMLIVLGATTFAMFPDPPPTWPLMSAEVIIAVLGPLVFFPASRTLWTAIDLMMRPLLPGEVDPRFVKVDPLRDRKRPGPPGAPRRR